MDWPTAITICVVSLCLTILILGYWSLRSVKTDK